MKHDIIHQDDHKAALHHKPRHMPEKIERYMGVAMVVTLAVLMVLLICGLSRTGSTTPSWMH